MPVLNNPVTKALALVKNEFHHGTCTRTHGPRGGERETVVRYRRMGATKTHAEVAAMTVEFAEEGESDG